MSDDAWRRKTYYNPRVLIRTAHILDCPFPDSLVCLTGAEQALLRNLTQYLHRRSTFASQCYQTYYLAPTNEEWDALEAIIADLEDKLMGCPEILTMLEDILAAALCACEGSGKTYTSPIVGPIYDDLEDNGTIQWAPPDGTPVPGVDDRCALAQLVYAMNYEILTEYLQPLQEVLHEVLLFAVLEGLALMLGGPLALVPGATLYHIIQAALDAWVEGELVNVLNALVSNKQDLVCAMFEAWGEGGSYSDAHAAAIEVINGVDAWSAIDKALFRLTFGPIVMKLCQTAWTAQTEWATSNVAPGYCDLCEQPPYYGDGWFAIPLSPSFEFVLGYTPYPSTKTIYDLPLIATERRVALLWEIVEHVGSNHVCCNTGPCGTPRVWNDGHVSRASAGWQYSGPNNEIDEQAVLDALCPGALISQLNTYVHIGQGNIICGYWRLEWATQPGHYFKVRPAWMVYKETP